MSITRGTRARDRQKCWTRVRRSSSCPLLQGSGGDSDSPAYKGKCHREEARIQDFIHCSLMQKQETRICKHVTRVHVGHESDLSTRRPVVASHPSGFMHQTSVVIVACLAVLHPFRCTHGLRRGRRLLKQWVPCLVAARDRWQVFEGLPPVLGTAIRSSGVGSHPANPLSLLPFSPAEPLVSRERVDP